MESRYRFGYCLWHRRAGKDLTLWNHTIRMALMRVGSYVVIFPTLAQARKIIWEGYDGSGRRFLEMIPEEVLNDVRQSDMRLELLNGSSIQLMSAEHPDRLRGMNAIGVVLSEYAFVRPEVLDILSPILSENGGWLIVNTTPNGMNHAAELWESAQGNKHWYTSKVTVEDSGALDTEELERERLRLPESIFMREYYCDFCGMSEHAGYYYADSMTLAHQQGRVRQETTITGDVHLAWDLGLRDATAVWAWSENGYTRTYHQYWEWRGVELPSMWQDIEQWLKQHGCRLGQVILPHDGGNRTLMSRTSAAGMLRRLLRGRGKLVVLARQPIHTGILRCLGMLQRAEFDRVGCEAGLRALNHYRREYDTQAQNYRDHPVHDWASHGADAFRYSCSSEHSPAESLQNAVTLTHDPVLLETVPAWD